MKPVTTLDRRHFFSTIGAALTLPQLLNADEPQLPQRPVTSTGKPSALRPALSPEKKLLHMAQDMPTPTMLRDQIAVLENSPFRGVVFRVPVQGLELPLHRVIWQPKKIEWSALSPELEIMKGFSSKQLTHNFSRINIEPGTVDWYDDTGFECVIHNVRLAARFARNSPNCVGICFDTEPYNRNGGLVLTYRTRPNTADPSAAGYRSLNDYSAKAKERGEQVMRAMQDEFPGLRVLVCHGWEKVSAKESPDTKVGKLLPPFLDGLLKGAEGQTIVIDGFERSYGFKTADQFSAARDEMLKTNLTRTSEPALYRQRVRPAFALSADYPHKPDSFDPVNTVNNHFQPEEFRRAIVNALQATDEFVWCYGYSTTGSWFDVGSKKAMLPRLYREAMSSGRDSYLAMVEAQKK